MNEEGDSYGETPRVAPVEVVPVGRDLPPLEENTDIPDFTPEREHMLLQRIHRNLPHHKDGLHLDGRVTDDAIWQRLWRRLATQSASWYAMP